MRVLAPAVPIAAAILFLSAAAAGAAPAEPSRDFVVTGATNDCNGDQVHLEGTMHVVDKTSADGSLTTHVSVHLKGTAESGINYVANESETFTFGSASLEIDVKYVLVSQGSQPNLHGIIHVDSAGGTTIENFCRG